MAIYNSRGYDVILVYMVCMVLVHPQNPSGVCGWSVYVVSTCLEIVTLYTEIMAGTLNRLYAEASLIAMDPVPVDDVLENEALGVRYERARVGWGAGVSRDGIQTGNLRVEHDYVLVPCIQNNFVWRYLERISNDIGPFDGKYHVDRRRIVTDMDGARSCAVHRDHFVGIVAALFMFADYCDAHPLASE